MTPLEQLLSPEMPFTIRYATAATRGLPIPAAALPEPGKYQRWTPEHDAILRERYGTAPVAEIAALVGRTTAATTDRAHKLDLCRSQRAAPQGT